MAARKVSRKRSMRKGRKPPLHIVSTFGTSGKSRGSLKHKVGTDRKLRSKGNFGAK
jgi:hypothetical protein